jgi:predicted deacylase
MRLVDEMAPGSSGWTMLSMKVDAFVCHGAAPGPVAVIVAGVHGDEYEGPSAVAELTKRLRPSAMHGSVVAIPVANPMAFCAAQRITPEDGLNLARTFPGKANGSVTEQLAATLFDNAVVHADFLIDLHSGGVEYNFLPLAGFYGDADSRNASYNAARRMGLPVLWKLPETAGVLSCEAWKRGIPSVGAEYLGAGQLSRPGVSTYVEGVLSCLRFWGICSQEKLLPESGDVHTGDWQLASVNGIFDADVPLGTTILPGDGVAKIRDLRGDVLERFIANSRGIMMAVRSKAYIRTGNWGVLIAAQA